MMDLQSESASRASLRDFMTWDHARLERLFAALLAALNADAREDTARLWSEFDSGLCTHMDFEERLMFPAFLLQDATEARALLVEHVQIRNRLTELGIGLDLHLTRADVMAKLVALLRSHAEREEALVYRWAEQTMPELADAGLRRAPAYHDGGRLMRMGKAIGN